MTKASNEVKEYQPADQQRKPNFFDKKRFVDYDKDLIDNYSDDFEEKDNKSLQKKQEPAPQEKKKGNLLEDFDDDEDDTDPWNLDSKNKKANDTAKPAEIQQPVKPLQDEQKKANPFEQKVKPAFEDLEDIGFELDSDRPVEFNNKKSLPEANN